MGKFERPLLEGADFYGDRADFVRPNGWRKASSELANSEQFAKLGEQASVPKSRAFVAIKRVGAYVGLKAGDMMLLDTLGAFTQAQDWDAGRRPIVWASNAYLMDQTGFSLSALKRHARRLAEAGAIAFQDSPNGKRWGRRDADGIIIEAYGFDLSPLSARAEEFETLYASIRAERDLCQRLKRQITVARRLIRARIEAAISNALKGPWAQLAGVFEDLLNRLPRHKDTSEKLLRLLTWFKNLQEQVDAAYLLGGRATVVVDTDGGRDTDSTHKLQKMNPREVTSEPHILTTNELNSVTCNPCGKENTPDVVNNAPPKEQSDSVFKHWESNVRKKRAALDVPVVMQACPEFATWAHNLGGYLKDWGDLHRIAGQLGPMIGVSKRAWNMAQKHLGKQIATTALALVFEKHSEGQIASPGGYLLGMVRKAGAGELNLERSLFGRLSKTTE